MSPSFVLGAASGLLYGEPASYAISMDGEPTQGVVLSPEPLDAVTGKVRECLLTASAAWARRVTGEGLQGGRGETHRAHFPVESGEQTRGKHQGSRVRGQGICAWPGERLPLVARRDWFLGSSGNSRRFSSDSPTTVRLWPLEIRLLCVGLRQESRGRGRSQRATPTHHKGSRPLRGGEWEVLVEGWTGRPRPDPGDGCRALSCLPGELWRVPR